MSRTIITYHHHKGVAKRFILSATALLLTLAAILTTYFTLTATTQTTKAAPVDPSCFTFDSGTGSITDYDVATCGTSVDIPSQIGGVDVVAVSGGGFYGKGLTAVTLPNTLVTITGGAFGGNSLTEIIIPNSVTTISGAGFSGNTPDRVVVGNGLTSIAYLSILGSSIGELTIGSDDYVGPPILTNISFNNMGIHTLKLGPTVASIDVAGFAHNHLTHVTIPSSVTFIGSAAFYNNNLTTVTIEGNPTLGADVFNHNGLDISTIPSGLTTAEQYEYRQNHAELVRITATDPDFIAANQDTFYTSTASGSTYITFGYLINPASVAFTYQNSANTALSTSLTLVGSNPSVTDYRIASILNTADPDSPTLDFASANYFRQGQTLTPTDYTLPTIEGYVTPEPRTFVLGAATNTQTFTYLTQAEIDAGITIDPDTGLPVVPAAPATGLAKLGGGPLLVVLGGVLVAGAASVAVVGARQQARR